MDILQEPTSSLSSDIAGESYLVTPSLLLADPNALKLLVARAREDLYLLFDDNISSVGKIIDYEPVEKINITLRVRGQVRGSMSGNGRSLLSQLKDAVDRSARDTRFSGAIVRSDLEDVTVEVWLQTSAEEIPVEKRESVDALFLGIDGVEVRIGSAYAYYKPSVALTRNFRSCKDLFSALCKKASLPSDAWKSGESSLRKTSWIHLCETCNREVIRMEALRPYNSGALTSQTIRDWVTEGTHYLKANQQADGGFCYIYLPFSDSSKYEETNPVRASGCAYSVAAAISFPHLGNNPSFARCADLAVEAILKRALPLSRGGMYVADNLRKGYEGKLGTTALLLLALLTKHFENRYAEEIDAFLIGIRALQSEDGLFQCSYEEGGSSDSQMNFFPGQALLALVKRAEIGDSDSWKSVQRAFAPYRDHFRARPATAFVGWQVEVWTRAASVESNQDYANFAFEQIDWILQYQLTAEENPLYAGGFSWNGRSPGYSSVVYTEAIARATVLAHQLGDSRWSRYLDAFHSGLAFCSRLRLTAEQAAFFPNPLRSVGGVATSLSDFTVRSDFVQHTITLALAALDSPVLLLSAP